MLVEALDSILHLRKGLPYTLKQVITRPGVSVREYVDGHRVKWYRPLAYIMLMGLVTGVVMQLFEVEWAQVTADGVEEEGTALMQQRYNQLMAKNYTLFQIVMLPLYALASFLIFKSSKFNYAENLVLNCYVLGTTALISSLFMVVMYFVDDELIRACIMGGMMLLLLVYHVVSYVRFFQLKSKAAGIVLGVVSYLMSTVLVIIVIGVTLFAYMFAGGMESIMAELPTKVRVVHLGQVESQHLDGPLVTIALPPDYYRDREQRYPVVYMHDGQNLFEADSSKYSKAEWGVDEALSARYAQGEQSCIVVAIHSRGQDRWRTLAPQKPLEAYFERLPNQADTMAQFGQMPLQNDAYLRFIVEELKPKIDEKYHTLMGPAHTSIAGSSMGGLSSWYALCEYPDVFGSAGCVSTHWPGMVPVNQPFASAEFLAYLDQHLPPAGHHRLWFDHGTETLDAFYPPLQLQVDSLLEAKGYTPDLWRSTVFRGTEHSEADWHDRFPQVLHFLLQHPDLTD